MPATAWLSDDEWKTLDAHYRDADGWWLLLSLYADKVQEVDAVAADGVRWLLRVRQRPTSDPATPGYWWWVDATDKAWVESATGPAEPGAWSRWRNYLPRQLAGVRRADDSSVSVEYPTPSAAVVRFLTAYVALPASTRAELDRLAGEADAARAGV